MDIKKRLRNLPEDSRAEIYCQFLSAYYATESISNTALQHTYHSYLQSLRQLWNLSPTDILVFQAKVTSAEARVTTLFEFLDIKEEPRIIHQV